MEITVSKCEQCGLLFEDEGKYVEHLLMHQKIAEFDGVFPKIEDEGCDFANGGWSVQRDKDWLDKYKARVIEMIGELGYPPESYGWFRSLDDSGHAFYGRACRMLDVCPKCYREWGQQYYANNCNCEDKPKK